MVKLASGNNFCISDQQITDSQGQTVHVFELEKVLNIDAQKPWNDFFRVRRSEAC